MPEPRETYDHQRWEGFGFPPYRQDLPIFHWEGDALFEGMYLRLTGYPYGTSPWEGCTWDRYCEIANGDLGDIRDFYDGYVTKFRESEDSYALYKQIHEYITKNSVAGWKKR